MYVNEKTKYPELFAGTYWAGFKVANETAAITPEIFRNRNWFAEHYHLQSEVRPKFEANRFAFTEIDHLEVYRDAANRIVVVCSNYGGTPPPALNMKPIRPIYSTATESYIRIFESVKEFRAAMRGESKPTNKVSRAREKARDLTKHPDIFAGTCWGAFSMDRNSEVITPEIISNRNMLVEQYGLKCCANLQFDRWQRKSETDKNYDLDHLEVYRTTRGGVAIVCSNYGCPPPPFLNMQPIPPVYTTQTKSYVACYPDLKTFRAAMRGEETFKTICMADIQPEPPTAKTKFHGQCRQDMQCANSECDRLVCSHCKRSSGLCPDCDHQARRK